MEAESRRFYQDAINKVTSADIRQLLEDLAAVEEDHRDLLVDKTKEKKRNRCPFCRAIIPGTCGGSY